MRHGARSLSVKADRVPKAASRHGQVLRRIATSVLLTSSDFVCSVVAGGVIPKGIMANSVESRPGTLRASVRRVKTHALLCNRPTIRASRRAEHREEQSTAKSRAPRRSEHRDEQSTATIRAQRRAEHSDVQGAARGTPGCEQVAETFAGENPPAAANSSRAWRTG